MPNPAPSLLQPRKLPVQARSTASVDAILEATIQVLLAEGRPRLTTTKVAQRAGVSVGTLYQYFPNKGALLKAVLKTHLETIAASVEAVCSATKGESLQTMAEALITGYLNAKENNLDASLALYSVSDSVGGPEIVHQIAIRLNQAIVGMLETSSQTLATDPQILATTLVAAMSGVTRKALESADPRSHLHTARQELIVLAAAYLNASIAPNHVIPECRPIAGA